MKNSKHFLFYFLIILSFFILNLSIIYTLMHIKKDQVKKEYKLTIEKTVKELEIEIFKKNINLIRNLASNKLIIDSFKYTHKISEVNNRLEFAKELTNADIVYLLNSTGEVISSSSYDNSGHSLIGNNYSFRKYFFDAINGIEVIYPAVGTLTNKRGIYFSTPVLGPIQNNILGVLVVKIGLNDIDKKINSFSIPTALISKDGVIFSSSNSEWMYKTVQNLTSLKIEEIESTRQFSDKKISPLKIKETKNLHFLKFPFVIEDWGVYIIYKNSFYNFTFLEKFAIFFILFTTSILTVFIIYLKIEIWKKKELEIELKKYYSIVEQARVSIMITDKNGIIEYVNPQLEKITGYQKNEILGKNPSIFKSNKHEQSFYKKLWETIENKETWINEIYNRKKDGSFYWERAIISPLLNNKKNIINYTAIKEDVTEKKYMEEKLKYQANIDEMTQTLNKRSGLLFLEKQLSLTNKILNNLLSICYIDINNLKLTNDSYGHNIGDEMIINVVNVIKNEIRTSDSISRFGGDEFLVVFPNCSMDSCLKIMERISKKINNLALSKKLSYNISISYGIAEYNSEEAIDIDTLIHNADKKMYQMKKKLKRQT